MYQQTQVLAFQTMERLCIGGSMGCIAFSSLHLFQESVTDNRCILLTGKQFQQMYSITAYCLFQKKLLSLLNYRQRIDLRSIFAESGIGHFKIMICLLYTSDAADDMQCVDLGGRRIIKKKKRQT
eukprot:TRINITY_DN26991_c0_g1_i3.p2 TRINITY_DN26991_c0_g1~~TRINITY_DN26991_c0_g1_i3.p2  ORF type:complete len:125 (+),score=10.19 TRINITY_DN26991_c0_g1_i3:196-570(+)